MIKKVSCFITIYLLIIFSCVFTVNATDTSDYANELINNYTKQISDNLNNDTSEILASFGLDEISTESLFNLSFSQVLEKVWDLFKIDFSQRFSLLIKMLGIIISLVAINGLKMDNNLFSTQLADNANMICICIISITVNESVSKVVTALSLSAKLIYIYAPILTILLSLTGNFTASTLYNSAIVALAQIYSLISEKILVPFMGIYFALVISLSLNKNTNIEKISSSINKFITTIISSMSTIFTLLISGKNLLAKNIDGILFSSGKYVISNFIPIIGPGISSIFSSIIGSVSLAKSTIGIFAVISALAINLPAIISLISDYFSLYIIELVAESFGIRQICAVIHSFINGVKLLLTIIFLQLVLITISTGIILTIKGEV